MVSSCNTCTWACACTCVMCMCSRPATQQEYVSSVSSTLVGECPAWSRTCAQDREQAVVSHGRRHGSRRIVLATRRCGNTVWSAGSITAPEAYPSIYPSILRIVRPLLAGSRSSSMIPALVTLLQQFDDNERSVAPELFLRRGRQRREHRRRRCAHSRRGARSARARPRRRESAPLRPTLPET